MSDMAIDVLRVRDRHTRILGDITLYYQTQQMWRVDGLGDSVPNATQATNSHSLPNCRDSLGAQGRGEWAR